MAPSMSLTHTLPLLHSQARMPVLGLGVWDSAQSVCKATCATALRNGYRHIDTAQVYHNEAEVAHAVTESGIPRDQIFVTTKVLSPEKSVEETLAKCERSVKLFGDYVDLFLVHSPNAGSEGVKTMWTALEALLKNGKAKAIGVSNFAERHIEAMKEYAAVWPPAVNQLELHPWLQQREAVTYCTNNQIAVQAYCPLTRMQKASDPHVVRIAKSTGKSPAQVLVRYCLEKGWVPLPKSDKEERIIGNADVFDFEISPEDMQALDKREKEDEKLCLCWEAAAL